MLMMEEGTILFTDHDILAMLWFVNDLSEGQSGTERGKFIYRQEDRNPRG
jgi:hypothetical protein